jgi:Na+/melibiose symporter-like transporter
MKEFIQNLRNQPEQKRRHILHVATIVAAIILVLLWIISLKSNLTNPDTQAKINNDLKPFSALKANIIGGYQSMTGSPADTQQ